jgi:hypothetical protein
VENHTDINRNGKSSYGSHFKLNVDSFLRLE